MTKPTDTDFPFITRLPVLAAAADHLCLWTPINTAATIPRIALRGAYSYLRDEGIGLATGHLGNIVWLTLMTPA